MLSYESNYTADVVKTAYLSMPKKEREPETIKKEEEIIQKYGIGKQVTSSETGFLAMKELLKGQNIDVQLSEKTEDFDFMTSLSTPSAPLFQSAYRPSLPALQNITYEKLVRDKTL